MKNYYLTTVLILCGATLSCAQEGAIKKKWSGYSSPKKVIYLAHMKGDIEIETYSGTEILLEGVIDGSQKSDEELIQSISLTDTLIIYTNQTCAPFEKLGSNKHKNTWSSYGYNWNKDCKNDNSPSVHIKLKIPNEVKILVSSVNKGDIKIRNVSASVKANHINGSIFLDDISGEIYAHTINGDVTLKNVNSSALMDLYSLNGDITANVKGKINANIRYKSFNGEFYTNSKDVLLTSMDIKKLEDNKSRGIEYKLEGYRNIKIGNGNFPWKIETFNGDVFLKEL